MAKVIYTLHEKYLESEEKHQGWGGRGSKKKKKQILSENHLSFWQRLFQYSSSYIEFIYLVLTGSQTVRNPVAYIYIYTLHVPLHSCR